MGSRHSPPTPSLKQDEIDYMYHHVFLPPNLPQEEDWQDSHEAALLRLVTSTLDSMSVVFGQEEKDVVVQVHEAALNLNLAHTPDGDLNVEAVLKLLYETKARTIPLWIREQNAALMISLHEKSIDFEAFELSPKNKAVMATKGRLRRYFPDAAVTISRHTLDQNGLSKTVLQAVAQMTIQKAVCAQPKARKAGQDQVEDRDTTDPMLVTGYLMSVLSALGSPTTVEGIWKNTREEILWNNTKLCWRRSPKWLLIRVVSQLMFQRASSSKFDLYKCWQLLFMSKILELASAMKSTQRDNVYFMIAKISRRLLKLEDNVPSWVFEQVRKTLSTSQGILEQSCQRTARLTNHVLNLAHLRSISPTEHTAHDLPELDVGIGSLNSLAGFTTRELFCPTDVLPVLNHDELPEATTLNRGCQQMSKSYILAAFDRWVQESLPKWSQSNFRKEDTCERLKSLISFYHDLARPHFDGDPEGLSIMLLIILEIWVECDIAACHQSQLLKDYSPEIPMGLVSSLTLPLQSQLERLHQVEMYIRNRDQTCTDNMPSVLSAFGTSDTFAARYYDSSNELKDLHARIEQKADDDRRAKRSEWTRLREKYDRLVQKAAQSECDFQSVLVEQKYYPDEWEEKHSRSCRKCKDEADASMLRLHVHEWPLPSEITEAKSVVFELAVPTFFSNWRDATVYVLDNVLSCRGSIDGEVTSHGLGNYRALAQFYTPGGSSESRVTLWSTTKPSEHTHRNPVFISTTLSADDVCLNNGMSYQYFDDCKNHYIGPYETTNDLHKVCTYGLPKRSSSLRKFLSRPPKLPNGLAPNSILAGQDRCPAHMTLNEYKAFCSVPYGHQIQWTNVLTQLSSSSLDFNKLETHLLLLQVVNQVGPTGCPGTTRPSHESLVDEKFGLKLLDSLEHRLQKMESNWESWQALDTFIHLTTRLVSSARSKKVKHKCLGLLFHMRQITSKWTELLRSKARATANDDSQTNFMYTAADIALTCLGSFDLELESLNQLLGSPDALSTFIQISISLQECLTSFRTSDDDRGHWRRINVHRWERLCLRAMDILKSQILSLSNKGIDDAVNKSWPKFRNADSWKALCSPSDQWLTCNTALVADGESLSVHLDLLTFRLRVNGRPLRGLPSKYTGHSLYCVLFGNSTIDVLPSDVKGMEYSSKALYRGYQLDLGMSADGELLVRAVGGGQAHDLVPRRWLSSHFPTSFTRNHVHWLDRNTGMIEFRPATNAWKQTKDCWVLRKDGQSWFLQNNSRSLVSVASGTAKILFSILSSIETSMNVHISLDATTEALEIDLPRLRLTFYAGSLNKLMRSHNYPGMYVDTCQDIGTLTGFTSKLVLCDKSKNRAIIVPDGPVTYCRSEDHVNVNVKLSSVLGHLYYRVDPRLERLSDNGSTYSKLVLCYLHALTSQCLPDNLTKHTGTEQALDILQSASLRSFERLSQKHMDLLQQVATLTPVRKYYPEHLQVMQTVTWDSRLSYLSQHDEFYSLVKEIFKQSEGQEIFYQGKIARPPKLESWNATLLERQVLRASTYRLYQYGAENHTTKHDLQYTKRCVTERAARAFGAADAIYNRTPVLSKEQFRGNDNLIWERLNTAEKIDAPKQPFLEALRFDNKWLDCPLTKVRSFWTSIHRALTSIDYMDDKCNVMMWLSAIAFANNSDMHLVHVLAALYNNQTHAVITQTQSIQSLRDTSVELCNIEGLLQACKRPYSKQVRSSLQKRRNESAQNFQQRRSDDFRQQQTIVLERFANLMAVQWPVSQPTIPHDSEVEQYFTMERARPQLNSLFVSRYQNLLFREYSQKLQAPLAEIEVSPTPFHAPTLKVSSFTQLSRRFLVDIEDIFSVGANMLGQPEQQKLGYNLQRAVEHSKPRECSAQLENLLNSLRNLAETSYQKEYEEQLREGSNSLPDPTSVEYLKVKPETAQEYLRACEQEVGKGHQALIESVRLDRSPSLTLMATVQRWPRICSTFFLKQLRQQAQLCLSSEWKEAILQYALSITELQRAERIMAAIDSPMDLANELRNLGHQTWNPSDSPESVLLEVENRITIRNVQKDICQLMQSPPNDLNSTMQFNMGEGKSSVIIPDAAISLADGKHLLRVLVGKPQSKQMATMLTSKLGGLIGRRVYRLPFSRALRFSNSELEDIQKLLEECIETGGVLLVQPEHILSFKLMAIERTADGNQDQARALLRTQHFFQTMSRDLVDESDENFSVKFELVYTMGLGKQIEMGYSRWRTISYVLGLVADLAVEVRAENPKSVEVDNSRPGRYPWVRILTDRGENLLLTQLAGTICEKGIPGLSVSYRCPSDKESILRYISNENLSEAEIAEVEKGDIWAGSTKPVLLLVRGLIAGGVLSFALRRKRYRVNYGTDCNRTPRTDLAVPFRAKDSPAKSAEFSHPDAQIALTSLSYYYSGLTDGALFDSLHHLLKSEKASDEFWRWTGYIPNFPQEFASLSGVNIKDREQCRTEIFPQLRFSKYAIDYYLSNIIFSKQMQEFEEKISASGWDLGETKEHPTTGFSGTNDSQHLLPLTMKHLNLPTQSHTNALVLENLLREENSLYLMEDVTASTASRAMRLLDVVAELDPQVRVILDVGAQVLEFSNSELAETWLAKNKEHPEIEAVVFVNDDDELYVLDRKGRVELLQISPFAQKLDACLVFLDESHTRGTDLRLPNKYRAAVTLGAGLTKDRLVQACMRLRKLGSGQSVVICIPPEIKDKILACTQKVEGETIGVSDVIVWSLYETQLDLQRSMPLWATQGRRFERQKTLWQAARNSSGINLSQQAAKKFLEKEAQSVEKRYRPKTASSTEDLAGGDRDNENIDQIMKRCQYFQSTNFHSARIEEEQERELSPEVEREREVQLPAPLTAGKHSLHDDIHAFVTDGAIDPKSTAIMPAFETLRCTTLSDLLDISQFPKDLLVTADFARTVQHQSSDQDAYQRSVQWVLSSVNNHLIVISPFEAQKLVSLVSHSTKVRLHTYAPRLQLEYKPLDSLDLYTVTTCQQPFSVPQTAILQLNLFAGQTYLSSFEEYKRLCDMLGLSWCALQDGMKASADGFLLSGGVAKTTFKQSPVHFLETMLMRIRHQGQGLETTDLGCMLNGLPLDEAMFDSRRSAEGEDAECIAE